MYLQHFNLKKNPFSISPDPHFLWQSPMHRKAYSILKYGIMEEKGFLVLTGEIGTGKTLLINKLVSDCPVPSIIVTIPDPGLRPLEFFHYLAEEAGMNTNFSGKGEFWVLFKQFVLQAYDIEKKVVLIIDEAQRLSFSLLEQIRLMSNILKPEKKLINIFFVGQNEFINVLVDKRSKAIRQRVTIKCHLEPFTEDQTVQYLYHRLGVAGAEAEIFSPEAIELVYTISKGFPRTINVVCDNALRRGFSSGAKMITADIIKSVAKQLPVTDKKPRKPKKKPISKPAKDKKPSAPPAQVTVTEQPAALTPIEQPAEIPLQMQTAGAPITSQKREKASAVQVQMPVSEPANDKLSQSPFRYVKKMLLAAGLLLLIGFNVYLIYNKYYSPSQSTQRKYAELLPKEKFLASKNKIPEMVPGKEILKKSKETELLTKASKYDKIVHQVSNSSGLLEKSTSSEQVSSTERIPQILPGFETDKKNDRYLKRENFTAEIPKGNEVGKHLSVQEADTDATGLEDVNDKFALNKPDHRKKGSSETPSAMPWPEEKITIYFKHNSNELSEQAYERLDQIKQFITQYPNSEIIIEGYSDSSGNIAYNTKLSERRADIVRFYFIVNEIDPLRITAFGFGAQNFIATNDTEEGRRLNRRVEIKIKTKEN